MPRWRWPFSGGMIPLKTPPSLPPSLTYGCGSAWKQSQFHSIYPQASLIFSINPRPIFFFNPSPKSPPPSRGSPTSLPPSLSSFFRPASPIVTMRRRRRLLLPCRGCCCCCCCCCCCFRFWTSLPSRVEREDPSRKDMMRRRFVARKGRGTETKGKARCVYACIHSFVSYAYLLHK